MNDYKFIDKNVEYSINQEGDLFIEVDDSRGIWAKIHKQDIEFMAKHTGAGIVLAQKQLFDAVVDANTRLEKENLELKYKLGNSC